MKENTIYIILGVVIIIYIIISITTRDKSKARKSRKFMGDYKKKSEKSERVKE